MWKYDDELEYHRRAWEDDYYRGTPRYADEVHRDRDWLRPADETRADHAMEWFDQALTVALIVVVGIIVMALAWLSMHLIVLAARLVAS
jgi:hypothetical protein